MLDLRMASLGQFQAQLLEGPVGAGIGFVMGASVDLLFSSYLPKSQIIRSSIQDRLIYAQTQLAKNPNFNINPSEERMKLTSEILQKLSNTKIDGNVELEMPYIKGFLCPNSKNSWRKNIEARKSFVSTMKKIGEENTNLKMTHGNNLTKGVSDLQKKIWGLPKKNRANEFPFRKCG